MDLSAAGPQVWVVILMALPGIAYAAARGMARGVIAKDDVSVGSRISQGLIAAVILDLAYLLLLGNALVDNLSFREGSLPDVRTAAALVLGLGLVLPALIAWGMSKGYRWKPPDAGPVSRVFSALGSRLHRVREWRGRYVGRFERKFSSIPTAWDWAIVDLGGCFVRIETASGKFIGGWFGGQSFISTYPEPHDVFVEVEYRMTNTGEFLDPVEGSMGFWYMPQDGDVIDWVRTPSPSTADGGRDE